MTRHRAASIDPGALLVPWQVADRTSRSSRLFHWDPWVRSFLVAQELIRSLHFVDQSGGGSPQLALKVMAAGADGQLVGPARQLVRMEAPGVDVFTAQIKSVIGWSELREDRLPEILAQIETQHCFWGTLIPIHTDRLRRTRELIEAAVHLAVFVEMRFKHTLGCWRPIDYSPYVQPALTTPGHGSLPSGHCTESYVIYEVLKALLGSALRGGGDKADVGRDAINRQFRCIAERVSMNRVVAGLHFPVDNVAGRLLGTVLGRYVVHRCTADAALHPCPSAEFVGSKFPGDEEFDPTVQRLFDGEDAATPAALPPYYVVGKDLPALDAVRSDILGELWDRAEAELVDLGLAFRS